MIRYTLLFLFISFICVYSFRDWYKALGYSIILLAVMERPDMPKSFFGVGGLSPYNIVMLFILMGWMLQKSKENLRWPTLPKVNKLLVLYMAIVFFSSIRMMLDYGASFPLRWI